MTRRSAVVGDFFWIIGSYALLVLASVWVELATPERDKLLNPPEYDRIASIGQILAMAFCILVYGIALIRAIQVPWSERTRWERAIYLYQLIIVPVMAYFVLITLFVIAVYYDPQILR